MKVSYEEIGQVLVTCEAADAVVEGGVVKVNEDGAVAPCTAGERICGVAVHLAEDGFAAVQVKGFITVACTDADVAPGWNSLVADGAGGVKKAAGGADVLVMSAEDSKAVICL